MVSFRFHLMSLTAVFLALAVGIAIGATVVDQATVDALRDQLTNVEKRVQEADKLTADLNQWKKFGDEAADELVEGRLIQLPVLLVGVQGIDRAPIDRFRQSLEKAGAVLEGTVWFTSKLQLEKADDVIALAEILGVPNGRPDELRRALVGRLASSWAGSGESNPLPRLIQQAFVEFDKPPSGLDINPATVPRPLTRFVVVSDAEADVPNDQLAVPFATQLAKSFPSTVLAVEGDSTEFVGPLRQGESANALSTVDNLGDFKGRTAGVLALQDLGRAKVGHYGTGPRASRLVPELAT
jgi:hypothetical protein